MSIPQEAKMMRTGESGSARGVVVVTAAGSEQGRRTAQELLDSGWCVAVTARTVAELARIMPGMSGHRLLAVAADPSDPRQVGQLLDRVFGRFGRIDSVLGAESSVAAAWRRRTSQEGEIAAA
ncbi:SDR family oxidoreductase [Rhodococcus sp. USK10]|nr:MULTISPECIES: SDR family NAD(P)-dependent oxidoreductase [Rhodococcus]QYB05078.1 SDR family oxidoreductase [Rhodococcus sp. USK10]